MSEETLNLENTEENNITQAEKNEFVEQQIHQHIFMSANMILNMLKYMHNDSDFFKAISEYYDTLVSDNNLIILDKTTLAFLTSIINRYSVEQLTQFADGTIKHIATKNVETYLKAKENFGLPEDSLNNLKEFMIGHYMSGITSGTLDLQSCNNSLSFLFSYIEDYNVYCTEILKYLPNVFFTQTSFDEISEDDKKAIEEVFHNIAKDLHDFMLKNKIIPYAVL